MMPCPASSFTCAPLQCNLCPKLQPDPVHLNPSFLRRALFLEGGIQMFVGQVVLGGLLGAMFNKYGAALPTGVAAGAVAVICIYVAAFAWSWCDAVPGGPTPAGGVLLI